VTLIVISMSFALIGQFTLKSIRILL